MDCPKCKCSLAKLSSGKYYCAYCTTEYRLKKDSDDLLDDIVDIGLGIGIGLLLNSSDSDSGLFGGSSNDDDFSGGGGESGGAGSSDDW